MKKTCPPLINGKYYNVIKNDGKVIKDLLYFNEVFNDRLLITHLKDVCHWELSDIEEYYGKKK